MKNDLSDLKLNLPLMLEVLNVPALGNNLTCPMCGEKKMDVWLAPDGFAVDCKKKACALAGDVIKVYGTLRRVGFTVAKMTLERRAGTLPSAPATTRTPPPPAKLPKLSPEQYGRLFDYWTECVSPVLLESKEVAPFQTERKISWHTLQRHQTGFDLVRRCWTFPVMDADGKVRAVKCHREQPAEGQPKSFWKRFNESPARCGWSTLWPLLESFPLERNDRDHRRIFIAEGELKALRILSAGFDAVAPTSGSGFKWTPQQAARFTDKHVVIIFDDDEAGTQFAKNTVAALRGIAASVKCSSVEKGKCHV